MRFELPRDLPPEDERAIIAALERYFAESDDTMSAWTLAGRTTALRVGTLQSRHRTPGAWARAGSASFASRGTDPLRGRGDAK